MNDEQVSEWKNLQEREKTARAALTAASQAIREFELNHRREHPLSESACNALRDAIREGRPLCCEKGKAFLDTVVDPIWAEHINDWAYDALTCRRPSASLNAARGIVGALDAADDSLRRLNEFLLRPAA